MKFPYCTSTLPRRLRLYIKRARDWMDGNFPPAPACLAAALLLGSGCTAIKESWDGSVRGPFHEIHNYYSADNDWQDNIQVVAVMPLVPGRGDEWSLQGVEHMQPVLTEELTRCNQFEAITITPHRLRALTGIKQVRPLAKLPNKFQEIIQHLDKEKGTRKVVDAILFCELSSYRPYPPLAMGWKLHLFDLETQQLVWAFDEVFDAGDPRLVNSLRRHIRDYRLTTLDNFREIMIIDSPRSLARYSLSTALETMRKKNTKEVKETADTTSSQ